MRRQLLLIEDEQHIAEAISFILTRDGWDVTHLAAGAGAVPEAHRIAPGLVILDHMLPDMSGLDVLAALRADPATCRVPVLMLTARTQARDREAAARAGVSRFMTKPFSNAEILAQVRALAGGAPESRDLESGDLDGGAAKDGAGA